MTRIADLDLGQVRAFVAAAESAHFGRAAGSLHLTQQALSKRIARLEAVTGTLFERHAGGVRLTTRGERLLPVARRLLAVGDEALAVASAAPQVAPLRVDVWSHLQTPHTAVLASARRHPEIPVELSMRRSLPLALAALRRGELDLAFGDVSSLDHPLPDDLRAEVVLHTPLVALVNRDGPLGAATVGTGCGGRSPRAAPSSTASPSASPRRSAHHWPPTAPTSASTRSSSRSRTPRR